MATKQEMEEELNDRLNTDIDWAELKKEDLEEIFFMMESDELVQKVLKYKAKQMGASKLEEKVDEWYPFKLVKGVL